MSRPASFRSWLNFVVPRDVADLGQEDRRHRGPDPRDRPQEPVGREPLGEGREGGLDRREAGLHGRDLRPEIRTGHGQPKRQAALGHRRAPRRRPLPALQDGGQLGPEPIRERLPHRPEGGAEGRAPAGLAGRQLGARAAEAFHEAPQLGAGAVGLTVEEDLARLQEIGAVGRVLAVVLVPGPVLGAAVPVGHGAGDEDDVRALPFEEAGDRRVVGAGGFQAAHHLAAPRHALGPLDCGPELCEPPRGVRDHELGQHDPGVGVPQMGHVLRLGDVEADEKAFSVRPQRGLQLPEAFDTDGVVPYGRHGASPSVRGTLSWRSL